VALFISSAPNFSTPTPLRLSGVFHLTKSGLSGENT